MRRKAGFICSALIRPVRAKWNVRDDDGQKPVAMSKFLGRRAPIESAGGLDAQAFLAWVLVGIPLAWGVWQTLPKRRENLSISGTSGPAKGRGYSWESPDPLALPKSVACASSNAKSFLLA